MHSVLVSISRISGLSYNGGLMKSAISIICHSALDEWLEIRISKASALYTSVKPSSLQHQKMTKKKTGRKPGKIPICLYNLELMMRMKREPRESYRCRKNVN